MIGARTIVPRAPIADIINSSISASSDVYSMFRVVRGYTGPCRQVQRDSDKEIMDFGFTAGGLYQIKKEIEWANGDTTKVLRWYNQNTTAGHPAYIEGDGGVGIVAGNPVMFNGFPAIDMTNGVLNTTDNIAYSTFVSVAWIGKIYPFVPTGFEFYGNVWSINAEGASKPFRANNSAAQDFSIYNDDASVASYSYPTLFTNPTLIVLSHSDTTPFPTTAWINGSALSEPDLSGRALPMAVGPAQLLVGGYIVHTFIVDGRSDRAIHDLAKTFNVRNWIYT